MAVRSTHEAQLHDLSKTRLSSTDSKVIYLIASSKHIITKNKAAKALKKRRPKSILKKHVYSQVSSGLA